MVVPPRVLITRTAADLLSTLQQRHGPVMFHQSGGCCDGSSPMCYPDGDFIVGDRDVLLGLLDVTCDRSARRCAAVDLRAAVRRLEAHPTGHRPGAGSRRRVQPGSARRVPLPVPRPRLHRRRERAAQRRLRRSPAPPTRRASGRPGRAARWWPRPPTPARSRQMARRAGPRRAGDGGCSRRTVFCVIPLPRAWLLTSAMLVGSAVGVIVGVVGDPADQAPSPARWGDGGSSWACPACWVWR